MKHVAISNLFQIEIEQSHCYFKSTYLKVSVQGAVALGGHFATLCREQFDFNEAFFFIINFQKEKANTLTLLSNHSYSEKSSNRAK